MSRFCTWLRRRRHARAFSQLLAGTSRPAFTPDQEARIRELIQEALDAVEDRTRRRMDLIRRKGPGAAFTSRVQDAAERLSRKPPHDQ